MGGIGQKRKKTGFFVFFAMGKTKKQKGEKLSATPHEINENKKNNENEKKCLIYFFNCDILLLVKGTETHESNENKAFRKIDKAPRTNRTETRNASGNI
jgi:hypothetical protein